MKSLWFDTDGLGRWLGFVRRSDGKTLIVWAYDDAKEVRTPAEKALEWGLEYDYEDVSADRAAKLYSKWLKEQAQLAIALTQQTRALIN